MRIKKKHKYTITHIAYFFFIYLNVIVKRESIFREPEKQIAETRIRGDSNIAVADNSSLSTIIAIIIGAIVTLVIIVMAVVSIVCSKNKRRYNRYIVYR